MSATGLEVFDRTLQTTNIWLDDIMEIIGPDRHAAWRALSVVLQRLRDRLPVTLAAHLGAQLPLLVRGAYYDQYQPVKQPSDVDTFEAFVRQVAEGLGDAPHLDPADAARAVFAALSRHISAGQVIKVMEALPTSLRTAIEAAPEIRNERAARLAADRFESRPH